MMESHLIPKRSIFNTIGCLCNEPSLLLEEGVNLTEKDFGNKFFKILFATINNLIYDNIKINKITAVDIDNVVASITQAYAIYETNNGLEYITTAIEKSNKDTFDFHYKQIKKFSLLRDFVENGFDISSIYDYNSTDLKTQSEQLDKLEKMELEDIIEHFNLKMIDIKNNWNLDKNYKSFNVGEGINDLLHKLNEAPVFGQPFLNDYLNFIFRGMQETKYLIFSAGTGGSKTRTAIANLCYIASDEWFDMDLNMYVSNGISRPCTFISTELNLQQIQSIMLAVISGVNEDVIKNGRYNPQIKERLEYAVKIIERMPVRLHYLPEYDATDIEEIVERDVIQHDVKFFFHDYIMYNGRMATKVAKRFNGANIREDLALVELSSKLKNIAERYNIFVWSATQLNRQASETKDTSGIRGSSAIIDKADGAVMMFRTNEREISNLKHILERGIYNKPNFFYVVYKNRENTSGLMVWVQRNVANMRETLCFVTDCEYNLLPEIKPLKIKYDIKEENIFKII